MVSTDAQDQMSAGAKHHSECDSVILMLSAKMAASVWKCLCFLVNAFLLNIVGAECKPASPGAGCDWNKTTMASRRSSTHLRRPSRVAKPRASRIRLNRANLHGNQCTFGVHAKGSKPPAAKMCSSHYHRSVGHGDLQGISNHKFF